MRRSRLLLAILAVGGLLSVPAASADAASLETRDASGAARTDFVSGETVVFRVTVESTTTRLADHRIYLYRGEGTAGSNVAIVDDGGTTQVSPWAPRSFEVSWDQKIAGAQATPGVYTAVYRLPDGGSASALVRIDQLPDHVLTALSTGRLDERPYTFLLGCVRNEGPVATHGVTVTVSGRGSVLGTWVEQATKYVVYGERACTAVPGGGTYFDLPFTPLAVPDGAALDAVRVEANAFRLDDERDRSDNVRTLPARWLV